MSEIEKFKTRLIKACDDSPHIPEYGKGRQLVIADHLGISQEAVRKYFAGLSMPKKDKMGKLAEFLGVDQAWLALGIKPEMDTRAKKFAGRATEGAVMVVAGAIQLAGGNCALPTEDDPKRGYIDIYAIIRGVKTDIYVSRAREIADSTFELIVPREFAQVKCLGFFDARGRLFDLVDLTTDLIERHKVRRAGDYTLTIRREGSQYLTDSDEWPRLKTNSGII